MTEKEKTAPIVSVGADTEQSILKQTNNSITDLKRNFNKFYIYNYDAFAYDYQEDFCNLL